MNVDINIFKNLYRDDIIYHYTKASTAIDYILYNHQLKFNNRKKSNDPIESNKIKRGIIISCTETKDQELKAQMSDYTDLHNFIDDLEKNFYQICFCKNNMGDDFANNNYFSNFKGHEELFGFTKLRMWDQYADKFTGVCIAFSKENILSKNNKLIEGDVEYFSFHELSERKTGDIQGNYLQYFSKEEYKNQIEQIVKQSFFFKHTDYKGENEYRIGTMYDKKKCFTEKIRSELVFDESMMLDISECIKAVFVSSYANDRQKSDLLEYAIRLDIPLIEMSWQHNSFEPKDYKECMKFIKQLNK